MDEVRILEIKQSVFANNDQRAELLRRELKEKRIFLLNLMSSPGSGKTTTLTRTIERLRDEFKIGVMEADIDSDVDARTIAATGVKSIQLHTGSMCHLDADMTRQGLDGLAAGDVELAVLETVGNLVCPAEFDTGAVKNAAILSVPGVVNATGVQLNGGTEDLLLTETCETQQVPVLGTVTLIE